MVVAAYEGHAFTTQRGAAIRTQVRTRPDGEVVALEVTDEFGKSAILDLDAEECARLAVNLLRDRSLQVNGFG